MASGYRGDRTKIILVINGLAALTNYHISQHLLDKPKDEEEEGADLEAREAPPKERPTPVRSAAAAPTEERPVPARRITAIRSRRSTNTTNDAHKVQEMGAPQVDERGFLII